MGLDVGAWGQLEIGLCCLGSQGVKVGRLRLEVQQCLVDFGGVIPGGHFPFADIDRGIADWPMIMHGATGVEVGLKVIFADTEAAKAQMLLVAVFRLPGVDAGQYVRRTGPEDGAALGEFGEEKVGVFLLPAPVTKGGLELLVAADGGHCRWRCWLRCGRLVWVLLGSGSGDLSCGHVFWVETAVNFWLHATGQNCHLYRFVPGDGGRVVFK